MKNNHKPKIRFPGVTGDWELCKLKDISKIHDGTHQTPKYKDSGVKFVSVEDINDIEASNKYISTEDYETQFKNKPEVGDIFMTRITAGIIGATAVIESDDPIAYYVSLALIKPSNKISSLFLSSYISTKEFKKELNKRIIHTAFPKKINLADIGECSVSRPSKEEQVKIGSFSKMLEDTIALHQQELIILKQTKQGFLQKMFPKEGKSVPEVRFPEFTGDWKQRRLDSMVDRLKSYPLSRDVETSDYTGYKYIHYGDIHTKVADKIDKSSNLPNIKAGNYELLEKGDLVLADASEDYKGIATPAVITIDTPYKLVSGLHTIALRPKQVDSLFLYYLIKSPIFRKYGYRMGTGMKVFGISVTNLMKFESIFPSLEEQTKIGNFFEQLDNTIALHQRELDTLKETKKAFLQKMFV